ncbi:MAG: putative Flp pilus-assembly TadE/G-like [Chloroflexota bacterium]|jgi:hypothetical protein|nr:putative Flp pilus-assembly TadE/G-like [Chloroflexota bacterium]
MSRSVGRRAAGQIVVIFALGLVLIALSVGLVIDGSTAFLQRRAAQNNADLGALAGTKVIANAWLGQVAATRADVYDSIRERMVATGCAGGDVSPCTWTAQFVGSGGIRVGPVTAGDRGSVTGAGASILGVRVDVVRQPRTFFLGMVGQSSWRIDTTATALAAKPRNAPTGQLLPIALHEPDPTSPFRPGQVYDLVLDKLAPGGFAWVSWNGSSRAAVADSTCAPNNPSFRLGSTAVERAPLDSDWGRARSCLRAWAASQATVLIPIYAADSRPPRYRILNVAAFVIQSVDAPDSGDVRASFVGTYAFPSAPGDALDHPDRNDSLYYLGLVN